MFTWLKGGLLVLGSLYFIVGLLLYFFQRQLLYYPNTQNFNHCPAFQTAKAITFENTRFYYTRKGDPVVVMYHGNAGSACDRAFLKPLFDALGYSSIFVEYTGFSNDVVSPSQKRLFKNVQAVQRFIAQEKHSRTLIVAESLGCAMAAYHTTLTPIEQVVLISPFETLVHLVQEKYPIFPARLLLKDQYHNPQNLENYKGQLTLIHGTEDRLIPIHHAKKLFQSVPTQAKRMIEISGAGHNDMYTHAQVIAEIQRGLGPQEN